MFRSRGRWPSSWPTAPVLGPGSIGRCRWSSAWLSAARRPPVWPRPPPSSPRTSGSKPAAGLARRRLCPSSLWTSGWESRRSGTLSRLLERLMSAGSRTGAFKLESYDDARKMALVVIFQLNDSNFLGSLSASLSFYLSLPLSFSLSLSPSLSLSLSPSLSLSLSPSLSLSLSLIYDAYVNPIRMLNINELCCGNSKEVGMISCLTPR